MKIRIGKRFTLYYNVLGQRFAFPNAVVIPDSRWSGIPNKGFVGSLTKGFNGYHCSPIVVPSGESTESIHYQGAEYPIYHSFDTVKDELRAYELVIERLNANEGLFKASDAMLEAHGIERDSWIDSSRGLLLDLLGSVTLPEGYWFHSYGHDYFSYDIFRFQDVYDEALEQQVAEYKECVRVRREQEVLKRLESYNVSAEIDLQTMIVTCSLGVFDYRFLRRLMSSELNRERLVPNTSGQRNHFSIEMEGTVYEFDDLSAAREFEKDLKLDF